MGMGGLLFVFLGLYWKEGDVQLVKSMVRQWFTTPNNLSFWRGISRNTWAVYKLDSVSALDCSSLAFSILGSLFLWEGKSFLFLIF